MSDDYKPDKLTEAAEQEWLETWIAGPGDKRSKLLDTGTSAPDSNYLITLELHANCRRSGLKVLHY